MDFNEIIEAIPQKPYFRDPTADIAIYCSDCRDVLPHIPDNCIDLVLTSPPYPGNNKMWGDLFKDSNILEAHKFLNFIWDLCISVLEDGGKLAINIANTKRRPYIPNTHYIYAHLIDKIEPLGEIIWNKGYGQVGTAWGSFCSPSDPSLADQHEYILIFRKYGERQKPEVFDKIPVHDFNSWRNSIWNIPPAKASEVNHIAPFPEAIPNRLITLYSFEGEVILDPFLGSGTTAYCAKKLGRKCIGIEIEPKYCQIAVERLSQMVMRI
jgi:site-specific DNA-methyltransferase (adenine-specific)